MLLQGLDDIGRTQYGKSQIELFLVDLFESCLSRVKLLCYKTGDYGLIQRVVLLLYKYCVVLWLALLVLIGQHYVLFLHLPLNSGSLEHGGQTLFKSLTLRVYSCI